MSGRHHTSLFTSIPVDFLGFIMLMQFRYLGQGGGGVNLFSIYIYILLVILYGYF